MATQRTMPIVGFAAVRRTPVTLGELQRRQAAARPSTSTNTKANIAKRDAALKQALANIDAVLRSQQQATAGTTICKLDGFGSAGLGALLKSRVRSA